MCTKLEIHITRRTTELECTYERSRHCLLCNVLSRTRVKDFCQRRPSATHVNDSLCYATLRDARLRDAMLCYAMVLHATPIPMTKRHPREPLSPPAPPINPNGTAMRTCREYARTLQQNQGKHGSPPRPPLKSKNSSPRIRGKKGDVHMIVSEGRLRHHAVVL